MKRDLEFRQVASDLERPVADLFAVFEKSQEQVFFAPHPFTRDQAKWIAHYGGKDFYSIAIRDGQAIGYGFLRGWDEGYDIPSLGIAIHPAFRGIGLGKLLMQYLHTVATLRCSKKMRLRVHSDNRSAIALYEKLGYEFQQDIPGFLVGYVELRQFQPTPTT